MGSGGVPCPKPEPRKRVKARQARAETAVATIVRAECVERDGYCRPFRPGVDAVLVAAIIGKCRGASQWSHLRGHRRSHTRGMAPEQRHSTEWTVMFCERHHGDEEAGRLKVTGDANKRLRYENKIGEVYQE